MYKKTNTKGIDNFKLYVYAPSFTKLNLFELFSGSVPWEGGACDRRDN
jgi:hypothetical protein